VVEFPRLQPSRENTAFRRSESYCGRYLYRHRRTGCERQRTPGQRFAQRLIFKFKHVVFLCSPLYVDEFLILVSPPLLKNVGILTPCNALILLTNGAVVIYFFITSCPCFFLHSLMPLSSSSTVTPSLTWEASACCYLWKLHSPTNCMCTPRLSTFLFLDSSSKKSISSYLRPVCF
jgi:hypothetical protein